MPELPEVETVRRTLATALIGRPMTRMHIRRRDVVRDPHRVARGLDGQRVTDVLRHGKQLAICFDRGAVVCVHLGMSGQLRVGHEAFPQPGVGGRLESLKAMSHVHVVWSLSDGPSLCFRDPRRFGGVWVFRNERALREARWDRLGPDGLLITPGQLHAGLSRTRRALKAALLDQHLVAGLGNIYVDELLYAVKLHPRKLACEISKADNARLVRAMRRLLGRAIDAGGSTLRDYVDASGNAGGFQMAHRVYGRGGEPCRRCRAVLETMIIAGRTTTACGRCQGQLKP